MAGRIIDQLLPSFGSEHIPSVEEIQDIVEKMLIEEGHAKTAKAYILYRQKRSEIREEKRKVLDKEEIDEVDKQFDVNALRVLKARYLRKDKYGKTIESPKQLFERVAIHVGLPDILYDEKFFNQEGEKAQHSVEFFDPLVEDGRLAIGKYKLNRYHLEALHRMYLRFNHDGQMKANWNGVIDAIKSGALDNYEQNIRRYYDLMVSKQFMPNTPALANFGNPLGMGSACFVLDIEDSLENIMDVLKNTSIVFKAGGGMGYNFSKLRPEGDFVSTTYGIASGPISFMKLFDTMTEVIKQGGIRRGANMGILNINHPDIEKFITAKVGNKALRNFNISVLILPDFWDHYERNEPYPLVNPRNGEIVRRVNPRVLFDLIVYHAWESAEPGVIFHDHVNRYNPLMKSLGPIVTTNPCGEVLLYPNESCNLGSINVWSFVSENESREMTFDWQGLEQVIRLTTRFLDNIIDVNNYPLKEIEEMTIASRKIGLGVMGLGDLLYEMGLTYGTEESRRFMEKLMEFINYHTKIESISIAKERGSFPYYGQSFYTEGKMPFSGFSSPGAWSFDWRRVADEAKTHGIRNTYTTVVAPTGSISMIAGCSSGMEPVYSLVFEKNVAVGKFFYVNEVFERVMGQKGLYSDGLMERISKNKGTVRNLDEVPEELRSRFVTAHEILPEEHIRALAAFQKWVDSSISKTNNFPADATVDDMRKSYLLAYQLGCKDVTVYRDTSITDQVLRTPSEPQQSKSAAGSTEDLAAPNYKESGAPNTSDAVTNKGVMTKPKSAVVEVPSSDSGTLSVSVQGQDDQCPTCETGLERIEGCLACPKCGWGLCGT